MSCTNEISIGYTVGQKPVVIIPSILLVSAGTMNGKDYYTWFDPWAEVQMIIFWDLLLPAWVVALDSAPETPLFYLNLPEDCPGIIGENNWQITESGGFYGFMAFTSTVTAPPVLECVSWENGGEGTATLPFPWDIYTFGLTDFLAYDTLYVGQSVASLVATNPYFPGVGYYTIGAIIYVSGSTIYHEPGPGRTFVGVVIIDANGEILIPGNNTGTICFAPAPEDNLTADQECFDILVWNKQCEFAQCVLKYLNNLQFGIDSCKELENLKNKRRALLLLNCYDTRDIANNTTDYNFLTYNQIKKLLK